MESKLSEITLKEMLNRRGFNLGYPDPKIAWDAFKEFSKTKIECTDEALLFQCGIYNFTGKNLFHWGFVRQFSFDDEDGDYDHMEQLDLVIYYKPALELGKLEINLWSNKFNTWDEFFTAIEELEAFKVPISNFVPVGSSINYGNV